MTKLDDFFNQTRQLVHPRLRYWKARLDEHPGAHATVELTRYATDLGQSQPELTFKVTEDGKLLSSEAEIWNDDLNAGLIESEIRADSPEQEADRFALGLRAAVRKAEREYGDGYFNAVLIDFIRESDLSQHSRIAEILKYVDSARSRREGSRSERYNNCRELIADAISGRAKELTGPLHYSIDQARPILVNAVARYLDERFSVSNRRKLGLL